MPLPAALLARLEKRGIINKNKHTGNRSTSEDKENLKDDEEVIAESYDDAEKKNNNVLESDDTLKKFLSSETHNDHIDLDDLRAHMEAKFKGYPGCPNKYNVWHECTLFCKEYWGDGRKKPSKRYLFFRRKMLEKYPLPITWSEVYDPGTGRYYYWDEENDAVSWLPPTHPRAMITDSAAHFREERYMVEKNIYSDNEDDDEDDADSDSDSSSAASSDDDAKTRSKRRRRSSSSEEDSEDSDNDGGKGRTRKLELEKVPQKSVRKLRINDLDPMDPAAYSDIPRGGWTDGLNRGLEAKTGADTTAAGPLYQMRPYPNPGAVLRANAKSKPSTE